VRGTRLLTIGVPNVGTGRVVDPGIHEMAHQTPNHGTSERIAPGEQLYIRNSNPLLLLQGHCPARQYVESSLAEGSCAVTLAGFVLVER
jgi:hypothetical protein